MNGPLLELSFLNKSRVRHYVFQLCFLGNSFTVITNVLIRWFQVFIYPPTRQPLRTKMLIVIAPLRESTLLISTTQGLINGRIDSFMSAYDKFLFSAGASVHFQQNIGNQARINNSNVWHGKLLELGVFVTISKRVNQPDMFWRRIYSSV